MGASSKNRGIDSYSSYLVGVGIGTALSPILLSALGTPVSTKTHWIVVVIGVVIILASKLAEKK